MSLCKKLSVLLALIGYSSLMWVVSCNITEDAKKYCIARTGLQLSDIKDYNVRNENCAVDCITKQGTVMSYFVEDGMRCHSEDGFRCIMGKCRSIEDSVVDYSGLYSLDIIIKSAFVPDMDPSPLAGESDVFVVVEVAKNDGPAYNDDEIICHTHIVQDSNNPNWRNFSCKPLPMNLATELRFKVIDSDKPFENHDFLGEATASVEDLMNNGSRRMPLIKGSKINKNYYVEIEVKGKAYKSG